MSRCVQYQVKLTYDIWTRVYLGKNLKKAIEQHIIIEKLLEIALQMSTSKREVLESMVHNNSGILLHTSNRSSLELKS